MYIKRNNELDIINLYLGDYRREFYLREISRLSKIPLKTTQNFLSNLEKKGIIRGAVRGKNRYFQLNLDNIQTKFCLLESEIRKTILFLDKYPLFKTFLKDVKVEDMLVVFGSFAKSKADKDSDLDLLKAGGGNIPLHLLPYKVHKIGMSENSFLKSMDENLIKEVQEDHVILNNHSLFVNSMWRHHG